MINPNDRKYNYLRNCNEKYMDYIALSTEDGRKITYEEMHDRICKYARMLYQKGVRQGDKIAVCMFNTPESVYLLYALDIIGANVIGLNPFENPVKTRADIELVRPKMIISIDLNYCNFKDFEKALNFSTILYSPFESAKDLKLRLGYKLMQMKKGNFKLNPSSNLGSSLIMENGTPFVAAPFIDGETTDIVFTGGSTGIHKGVELCGNGLNYVVDGMGEIFKSEPGMIHLGNIPFGHMVYGRMIMHLTLCSNMEFALTLKATDKDFYDELVRTHAHAAVGGPPHWVSLIQKSGNGFVPNSKLRTNTLTNLKYATSGGEAKKASTDAAINAALEYCGSTAKLGDGLGATETWSSISINNGNVNTQGSLGNALSCLDIKLVNPDTFEEVKPGEPGILLVSGPTVMLRYFNNPEETDKVLTYDEDGIKWCNLGDFVVQLPTDEYKYVGRQKRNFVSGMENIYPEELEDAIVEIPEIKEIVVTPISDEMRQFIPRFHISLADHSVDTDALEDKIKNFIFSKFSENWLPGYISYYYEPLKRMSNSKVDVSYYRKLDEEAIKNGTLKDCKLKKLILK